LSNVLHGFLHSWNTIFYDISVANRKKFTGGVVVVLVEVEVVEVEVVAVEVEVGTIELEVVIEVVDSSLELGSIEGSDDENKVDFDVAISIVEDVEVVSADADSLVLVPLAPEKADRESELVALFPTSPNDSRSDELVGGFELSTASVAT